MRLGANETVSVPRDQQRALPPRKETFPDLAKTKQRPSGVQLPVGVPIRGTDNSEATTSRGLMFFRSVTVLVGTKVGMIKYPTRGRRNAEGQGVCDGGP
jgi:hypothetical protein